MSRGEHLTTSAVISATVLDETIQCDVLSAGLGWKLDGFITEGNADGWNL